VLKLLAGSLAGAGLSVRPASLALANEPPILLSDGTIALQIDAALQSRILARQNDTLEPLTDVAPSETLRLSDGRRIERFPFVDWSSERVNGAHGPGIRHVVRGRAPEGIEKQVATSLYERHPGFALQQVSYRNLGTDPLGIEGWANGTHVLTPAEGKPEFWSYSGASYADRRDWVQSLYEGFAQRNFMGMNATDYGGGTPVLDVWRRDWGLAVGHLAPVPKLVTMPLTMTTAGARVAVEHDQKTTLQPGESFSTLDTFVSIHRGDFFSTLETYRQILSERGMTQVSIPPAAYDPVWCGWGYQRDFTLEQMLGTLPKARDLGLDWAVLDDGWQTSIGDWDLDPAKFPRGDADMIAFVKSIKTAGMKPRLWLAPLAAQPSTQLLRDHPDMLLLDKSGAPQDLTGWDSFILCPAYLETVNWTRRLVRKMIGLWGFEGLKIDGQHLNGVAPCFNPAHKHARPEESIEKLQDVWKAVYDEATAINPDTVIEFCPCGTSYSIYHLPHVNQAVGSDPLSSWQIRHKGKMIKALMGASAAYAGDHVELSDRGSDFASTVGIGAVASTKFTWPRDPNPEDELLLTPQKEAEWRKWIALYNAKRLPEGTYLGGLYDIGFDKPEAHAIRKDDGLYYAFYADRWSGPVELRGLGTGRHSVTDYWTGRTVGVVSAVSPRLRVAFERFLLLEATPLKRP
jgi:alpha-galactosidase